MRYTILASGSKGNSCLLESNQAKVLIDCGSTKRYLSQCFQEMSLQFTDLDAIVLTHNHSDHFGQYKHFSFLPSYAPHKIIGDQYVKVTPYESFSIKDMTFYPIPLSHDVNEIVGYIVFCKEHKLIYITDTGYIKQTDLMHCVDAQTIIMESNYQTALLMESKRPYLTKMRIMSDTGHLSNDQCGQYCSQIVTENTQEIVLAHLSCEANDPNIAMAIVSAYVEKVNSRIKIRCAKQFEMVSGGYL